MGILLDQTNQSSVLTCYGVVESDFVCLIFLAILKHIIFYK